MFQRNTRYTVCPRCRAKGHDRAGDNLVLWPDGSGHCFACGYHQPSKYHIPQQKVDDGPKSLRPSDLTREIPIAPLKWLLQYGLPWSYWQDQIAYSPREERLVFSVRCEGTLAFSVGRYFGSENKRKWYVWGEPHRHCHVLSDGERDGSPVVLVEDLISAHKVAAQGYTTIPLFGVKVHPPHMYYLINSGKPVTWWLDADQRMNVKKEALHLASIIDKPVNIVSTEKDPKLLSSEEIHRQLQELDIK